MYPCARRSDASLRPNLLFCIRVVRQWPPSCQRSEEKGLTDKALVLAILLVCQTVAAAAARVRTDVLQALVSVLAVASLVPARGGNANIVGACYMVGRVKKRSRACECVRARVC